jgi:regulator of protease activity HflC (stomatin/prohibitin superfamily)
VTHPFNYEGNPVSRGWKVAIAAILIVVLGLLFWMFSYRQVQAGEIGIITRGGDVHRVEDAGPMVKLPWPIESLHKMDVKVQKEEQDAAAASADLQDVTATLVLNYHLDRDEALSVFSGIGPDYKDRVITPALQEVFKATSAQFTAEQLITQRAQVKAEASELLRTRLASYGVIVDDLSLTNFGFSEQFTEAVEARQVAEQQALQAQAQAEQRVAEATGRRDSAQLDAEAQELLQESLTDELLQKWWIEKWDGHMPQFVGSEGSTLFQVPLNTPQE